MDMDDSSETASLLEKLRNLQNIPDGVHWFCPRQTPHDQDLYFDEDLLSTHNLSHEQKQQNSKLIDEAKTRKILANEALKIFAFDGKNAELPQEWMKEQIAQQLQRCDICIREFHRSREDLKQQLERQYDPNNVMEFLAKFDGMNIERIERGLASATEQLRSLPAKQRGIAALDRTNVYPLFEAFNCMPFYTNETRLSQSFDEFFALVQTNRLLKLNSYSPAMFSFLFGSNRNRADWAIRALSKVKRNIAPIEFEHCVRQPLENAMSHVQLFALEKEFLKQFWEGVNSIVRQLDGVQIAESLRTLHTPVVGGQTSQNDLCYLALSHLQVDDDALKSLTSTIEYILQVSPKSFWDALDAIPIVTWIDQFFSSPALHRLLAATKPEYAKGHSLSPQSLFGWIMPFLNSVSPTNQIPVCRSLVDNLKRCIKNSSSKHSAESMEVKITLEVITISLENINRNFWDVLLPFSRDALTLVSENLPMISAAGNTDDADEMRAEIFKQAISLDCKCLVSFSKPSSNIRDPKDEFVQFFSIWDAAFNSFKYRDKTLPKHFLNAIRPLAGIEAFVAKGQLTEEQKQFNHGLGKVHSTIAKWLDRICQFTPSDLLTFFMNPDMITSLMIVLFLPDESVQLAVVEMIKTFSGKPSRKEAISYLLQHQLVLTLNGISRALRTLEQVKNFTPSLSVLKPCSDVLDSLCNNTDGILRSQSQTLSDAARASTEIFWQSLWTFLTMVFSSAERWSNMGHERGLLEDLCRHTMQFAGNVFDQFGVIRGALSSSSSPDVDDNQQTGKRLIEQPKLATAVIIKWLKLRDEVLVTKSCALVCKLLIRLTEFGVQLDETSLTYVMGIAIDREKSTLSRQQKAELLRALETHSGMKPEPALDSKSKPSLPPSKATSKEKEKIDLKQWASKADNQPSSVRKPAAPGKEKPSITPTFDKVRESGFPFRTTSKPVPLAVNLAEESSFKKKREQELAEKKKRDALVIDQRRKQYAFPSSISTAGSALKNLGVVGKEHDTPNKVSTMMVSSGEEDSSIDESSEEDDVFFGSNGTNQMSNALTAEQAKAMKKARGPVKKQRLVRSARDMRARLSPDLSPLHKTILGWEYFHDSVFPPKCSAEDYSAVLDKFKDPHTYQQKFQSLLLLEAWNAFLKAREENSFKPYAIKVIMRSSVDFFFEVSSTMSHEEGKDIMEGDIVLLSKAQSPASSESALHCLSRVHKIARKKTHLDVLYRTLPGLKMGAALLPGVTVYGLKITSIIPLEREYGALLGLQYYDLCDEITRARPSPLLNYSDERLNPVMKNYGINKAQAKAVRCALDNDAFTLVQGPPGSGKTKTIVAIVGALLTNSLKAGTVAAAAINQPKLQGVQAAAQAPLKKMLVCAPSNAAVDELVMRFKEGVRTMEGQHHRVNVIRIGRSDAINAEVQDVTLDELVNKKLNLAPKDTNSGQQVHNIMAEHKVLSEKLRDAQAKMDEAEAKGTLTKELQDEYHTLRRQKALLGKKVDDAKENETAKHHQAEVDRKKAQQEVLDSANIICATLSGSGHDLFLNLNVEFETVVIDEAAQCVEMSALIPLKYGCAKCVLVGDPQQLPPTIFSKDAARFKYEQSLFVRMQRNHPEDVHLLDTQYRMHPIISSFPSKAFYGGKLLDGKDMRQLRTQPWHSTELLSPFRFFDVHGKHQSAPTGHSLTNPAEVKVAMELYRRLIKDFPSWDSTGNIGIITPYKSQLRELRASFKSQFGPAIVDRIEFNTTDAFQGRESEVIIFSCVRASPEGGIGFLQDVRRMNVGLTRAKSSLWVLGNSQSLMRGEYWAKLVEDAKSRRLYTTGDIHALLSKPLKVLDRPPQEYSIPSLAYDDSAMDVDEAPPMNSHVAPPPVQPDLPALKKRRFSNSTEDGQLNPNKKQAPAAPPAEASDVEMADSSSQDTSSPSDSSSPPSETNVTARTNIQNGENSKVPPVADQGKPMEKPPVPPPPSRPPPKKQQPNIFIPKKKAPPRQA